MQVDRMRTAMNRCRLAQKELEQIHREMSVIAHFKRPISRAEIDRTERRVLALIAIQKKSSVNIASARLEIAMINLR
jgi:hypothetical protein